MSGRVVRISPVNIPKRIEAGDLGHSVLWRDIDLNGWDGPQGDRPNVMGFVFWRRGVRPCSAIACDPGW